MRSVSRVTAAVAVALWGSVAHADPGIGSSMPVAPFTDRAGAPAVLSPRAGSVLVVDFFATWCGPCHEALAALDAIARDEPARVRLVVVAVGEDPAVVERFLAERPLPPNATLLFDQRGVCARIWGQHRFPTTFVVDAHGTIRRINRGYGPGYPARVRGWVASLLGAGP